METIDDDLEIAYELQLQEAMSVSLQEHESNSISDLESLELMLRLEQEEKDAEEWEKEMVKIRNDLKIQTYDYKFAQELVRIPDDEWAKTGDNVHKPYGYGEAATSSSASVVDDSEPFRLYFKGLYSSESESEGVVCAIGAAVCDSRDNLILNVQKPLNIDDLNKQDLEFKVEVEALMEGLKAALSLDIRNISFFCDFHPLFQYITTRWLIKEQNIEKLVDQVCLLQRKFDSCLPFFVARKDVKFAFKLARDAIDTLITRSAESNHAKNVETCNICLDDIDICQMFAVDGCLHRYCLSCMKQHVQVKLLHEMMLRCPYEGCKTELDIAICRKFLPTELIDLMEQRLKESSISVTDRVYCPDPRCSKLMSKPEMLSGTNPADLPAIKCIKCHGLFCINCEVPWHSNISCDEYKRLNSNPSTEDAKLKSLATTRSWSQCTKCKNMIELAEGCYHITCRCGYEFCYTCGAEWHDKKPTCKCPIWDEHNIMNDPAAN